MKEPPPQVPRVEQPQAVTDNTLETLEEDTLDKQAKSAAYRAAKEHSQHVLALNERISVLQAKLDKSESDCDKSKEDYRRVASEASELRQAKRTARVGAIIESIGAGGGTIILSMAPFMTILP